MMDVKKMMGKMNGKLLGCGVLVLVLLAVFMLCRYNGEFKNSFDRFSEYPSAQNGESEPATVSEVAPASSSMNMNELLPKNNENLINKISDTNFTSIIGVPSVKDTRNANLQLRSDPVIPKVETGPFNMSTITQEGKSTGLDICSAN